MVNVFCTILLKKNESLNKNWKIKKINWNYNVLHINFVKQNEKKKFFGQNFVKKLNLMILKFVPHLLQTPN